MFQMFKKQGLQAHKLSRDAILTLIGKVEALTDDASELIKSLKSARKNWKSLFDRIPSCTPSVKSSSESLASVLDAWVLPLLSRIAKWLGHTLLRLLTPKEWKLGGEVGTGVFGLANARVEVTFGWDPPPSNPTPPAGDRR
jgi:hypothetical protein